MLEKTNLLEALSIEELQERNEFTAAATEPDGESHCVICTC